MPAKSPVEYVVNTNLDPSQLSMVSVEIFSQWLSFALGGQSLGGRMLKHPTGRYAASIGYQVSGESQIAILADDSLPEAGILEAGHGTFDLKTKFQVGRRYPMHRGGGAPSNKPSMWATARRKSSTGFASIGKNSPADSWVLPVMHAYSPAKILAELAAKMGREGGIP